MTDDNTDEWEAVFEDADDRDDLPEDAGESLTPGGTTVQEMYGDPDADADYDSESQTWLGEVARAELRLETLDGTQVKRFSLAEPQEDGAMDALIRAVIDNDRYLFVRVVVDSPEITDELWEEKMTPRERALLYDHAWAWMRMEEFVSVSEDLG